LQYQLQHSSITHPPPHEVHEELVIDRVEVALDIGINNPPAAHQCRIDFPSRLRCTSLWSKPVRLILKVGLEDRFDDDFACLLDDSIPNRRDS
jgi:hypothetical protein